MVSNIDENVGRVLGKLKELGIDRDTIIVFLTDNGPQRPRFNAGMRGLKGTPYDGGIRVPCYVKWPAGFGAASGAYVDRVAAHIDIAPTLLDACGLPQPPGLTFDGMSLLPLLRGDVSHETWPDRTLFFQWHRGETPDPGRSFAARSQRWKLVQPAGANGREFQPRYELYDLTAEPHETRSVADRNDLVVEQMRDAYQHWFEDVTSSHDRDAPRIVLGTPHENPAVLTRQDWRGPRAGWGPKDLGYWDVDIAEAGDFEITIHLVTDAAPPKDPKPPADDAPADAVAGAEQPAAAESPAARRVVHFRLGAVEVQRPLEAGQNAVKLPAVKLPAGAAKLEGWVSQGEESVGVRFVEVLNLGEPIS
jgi:hypothetical protein